MPGPQVVLLERVRFTREQAERARRLARAIGDAETARRLEDFAAELDQAAADLERQVSGLAEQVSRRNAIETELSSHVVEAQAWLHEIMSTLKRDGGAPDGC